MLETHLETLLAGLSKWLCWGSPHRKNCRWPLGAEGARGDSQQEAGALTPDYSKETAYASNLSELEVGSSANEPSDENTATIAL